MYTCWTIMQPVNREFSFIFTNIQKMLKIYCKVKKGGTKEVYNVFTGKKNVSTVCNHRHVYMLNTYGSPQRSNISSYSGEVGGIRVNMSLVFHYILFLLSPVKKKKP